MQKKSFTQIGFLYYLEFFLRSNIYLYLIFRSLAKFLIIFENDFNYLKFFFKNKKINIIDVGASDGISANFFLKTLNINKIYCYEPHGVYLKKLKKLKHNIKKIHLFGYGLSTKSIKKKIFYPVLKFFNIKIPILSYTFYSKKILENQIKLDFKNKLIIENSLITLKKFKLINQKIDFIKIDTNGHELNVVKTMLHQINKDKPLIVIENNNDHKKIFNLLKKNYQKYYYKNKILKIHKNELCINIFYINKLITNI
jgi:FkbM family methyltransferase